MAYGWKAPASADGPHSLRPEIIPAPGFGDTRLGFGYDSGAPLPPPAFGQAAAEHEAKLQAQQLAMFTQTVKALDGLGDGFVDSWDLLLEAALRPAQAAKRAAYLKVLAETVHAKHNLAPHDRLKLRNALLAQLPLGAAPPTQE